MIKNNDIPGSIYYDHMPDKLSWFVEKKVWIYRTKFTLSSKLENKERIYLYLNGVDTYSEVYVNNKLVGKTYDFFTKYKFDITNYINRKKTNIIEVKFFPYNEQAQKFYKKLNYSVPAGWIAVIRKVNHFFTSTTSIATITFLKAFIEKHTYLAGTRLRLKTYTSTHSNWTQIKPC